MQVSTKQIMLVAGCLAIGTGLWFGDQKGPEKPKKEEVSAMAGGNNESKPLVIEWDRFMDSTLTGFPLSQKGQAMENWYILRSKEDLTKAKISSEQLVQQFAQEKNAPAMAYVRDVFAQQTNESPDWQNAGKEYYRAAQTVAPEWRSAIYEKAISCFEKALKGKENNPELLTSIGVCYVEGSTNPMKGIGYLRNALEVDSTFAEAHFQLGLFAIQSGQFEKAEARMKKVLELKPTFISAHLYLGQIYQQIGQKSKALESLQKYKDLNSDPLIRAEVDKYLQELKNT
jgi:tetratricopeptide (TPR) repeat protein